MTIIDLKPYVLPSGRIDVAKCLSGDDRPFKVVTRSYGRFLMRSGRDQISIGCKYPNRVWQYSLKHLSSDFFSQLCVIPSLEEMISLVPDHEETLRSFALLDRLKYPMWYPYRGHPEALKHEQPCTSCGKSGIVTFGQGSNLREDGKSRYYCRACR